MGPARVDGAVQWGVVTTWVVAFVAADFMYYWTHRLSHEINVLWAGHVVHHSSEEYNLAVALRQSSLHGLFTWVFYVPVALVGIPWEPFAVSYALNLIYQFWIHTREIRTLGPAAESVLNTPSHHRVHHGVNPEYQDKNYAGVFIIWDRLFGTFEPERAEPVYGITTPLATWNPVWANVHVFRDILRDAWRAPTLGDKWRVIFGRPGWKPAALGPSTVPKPVSVETFAKFDPPASSAVRWYVFVHFTLTVLAAIRLLQIGGTMPTMQVVAAVFYVGLALANFGGMLEGQAWAASSEWARLGALGVAGGVIALGLGELPQWSGAALLAGCALSALWVLRLRRHLTATPSIAPALLM
jgi:hypothetical protein